MTNPILSILIPTVYGREQELQRLLSVLSKQLTPGNYCTSRTGYYEYAVSYSRIFPVEVIYLKDNKQVTVGEKREKLYQMADGVYSWQIDDDDSIAEDAISKILFAAEKEPDCITFLERCLMNGRELFGRHSLDYPDWEGEGNSTLYDGFHFHRTPYFKSVIKTAIVKQVPVPHMRYGEDHQWARLLKPYLKNESHIPEYLYHYIHHSTPEEFAERYGTNRQQ